MGTAVHAVHYLLVVGGLVGVAVLLTPQLASRGRPRHPRSPHEQRVADLRLTAEAGMLGTGVMLTRQLVRTVPTPPLSFVWLPVAVVASTAAAGVHAAVGPAHLEEGPLIGGFFVLSSAAQLGWAALAVRGASVRLLRAGVLGSAVCIALWAATRTTGLPFGLIPGPEPVGAWDLAAVAWELVLIVACVVQLSKGPAAAGRWTRWPTAVRAWLVLSVIALGVLSATGTGG